MNKFRQMELRYKQQLAAEKQLYKLMLKTGKAFKEFANFEFTQLPL